MKRLLVTGLDGFVGGHVRRIVELDPTGRQIVSPESMADVRDALALARLVSDSQPDEVIHLAAQSHVPASFENPRETFDVNFFGTLNLLEALGKAGFSGRLLFVSSGDVYGLVSEDALPVTEDRPAKPRNPYAVSKVAAEALCYQWSQTGTFDIVIARPFNHIGPGQSDRFAISGFAKQLASTTLSGRDAFVDAGDLEVTRDFTDVIDVVSAYLLLLDRGRSGEIYNIASGVERRLADLLATLGRLAGVKPVVRVDHARFRPSEQRRMRASASKIESDTGWKPTHTIEDSLSQILEYWKMELKQ